jgi:hypothetical protein
MGRYLTPQPFTMRNAALSLFSLLFSTLVSAQSFSGFSDLSILLKSDNTTKSVLMSDFLENRVGDLSPIIGSAVWIDNGRQLQCRSLISFEYGMLLKMISAEQITNAQLVLIPLQVKDEMNSQELKLTIRRVLQPWKDSTTCWLNQPLTTNQDEVKAIFNRKKKDQPVKINVTELVKNMFRFGNNGFFICYTDSMQAGKVSSHWFTSARYEDEKSRPFLLITYLIPVQIFNNTQSIPPLPLTARDRNELMQMYIRPEPVIVSPPTVVAETPPLKQKVDN